jgi:hypothetical protein
VTEGRTVRPLTAEDADRVVELLAAAQPVDGTGRNPAPGDLVEWWSGELVDLACALPPVT